MQFVESTTIIIQFEWIFTHWTPCFQLKISILIDNDCNKSTRKGTEVSLWIDLKLRLDVITDHNELQTVCECFCKRNGRWPPSIHPDWYDGGYPDYSGEFPQRQLISRHSNDMVGGTQHPSSNGDIWSNRSSFKFFQ